MQLPRSWTVSGLPLVHSGPWLGSRLLLVLQREQVLESLPPSRPRARQRPRRLPTLQLKSLGVEGACLQMSRRRQPRLW